MIAGGVSLKVEPQVLYEKADLVSARVEEMQRILDEIRLRVDGTKDYWIGEAGDLHREMYISETEAIENIMHRLREHPIDLRNIAKEYLDTEAEVTRIAEELPTDILK